MTGHGSLISSVNSIFLYCLSRVTSCRFCEKTGSENWEPNPHDCRRNWQGSSKAMEPSAAVELPQNLDKNDAALDVIIMDDDIITIAKLKSEYNPEKLKCRDVNHAEKFHLKYANPSRQSKTKMMRKNLQ